MSLVTPVRPYRVPSTHRLLRAVVVRPAIALSAHLSCVRRVPQLSQVRPNLLCHAARTCVQKPICRNHVSAIDAHTQLAQAAAHRLYLNFSIASKLCRHPGGYRSLDGSDRTEMDHDRTHRSSLHLRTTFTL